MGNAGGFELLAGFIPLIMMTVPLAIGAYHVAKVMDRNRAVWIILALIPIVNLFFMYYFMFVVIIFMLNRLKAIEALISARSP